MSAYTTTNQSVPSAPANDGDDEGDEKGDDVGDDEGDEEGNDEGCTVFLDGTDDGCGEGGDEGGAVTFVAEKSPAARIMAAAQAKIFNIMVKRFIRQSC